MKLYLAGPMRGYPEYNFPAFHEATQKLMAMGHAVWSPAQHDVNDGFDPSKDEAKPLREYMKADLVAVLNADAVAVLEGWEKSQGASLEVYVAGQCGIPTYEVKDLLCGLEDFPVPAATWSTHREMALQFYGRLTKADAEAAEETLRGILAEGPKPPKVRETILEEAQRLTHVDRQADYGHPEDDFTKVVGAVNAVFGTSLEATDWPLIMVIAKIAREHNKHKRDNVVDMAGYANTLDMVHQRREGR